ncbi:MAG: MFS transporter [Acidobacteriota bacterium]
MSVVEDNLPWYRAITSEQWKALIAAQAGWMLDAMDVMLYAFALTAIRKEFNLTAAEAGALASGTLVASAFGGILFGMLADRIGRARSLMYSILVYSIFTAMTATAGSMGQLIIWRTLVGIGLGGEWSAGSVLVSETWPDAHRGKAIGLMQSGWAIGYIMAAVLAAAILPSHGWRWLFAVGVVPALLAVWIRGGVKEPEIWRAGFAVRPSNPAEAVRGFLAGAPLRRLLSATALTTSVLFAYWGLFTWIPAFLSSPVEAGGAGMSIVKSSAWVVPMQIGAFFGYILFGFLADRLGRRPVFIAFLLVAAALVPLYGSLSGHETVLLCLGPLVGFFGHGYFSVFGAMLAELFPTRIRATAQGFAYNMGRAVSALAPYTIGAVADVHGIGSALALTSVFFLLGAGLMMLMPETKGSRLG